MLFIFGVLIGWILHPMIGIYYAYYPVSVVARKLED